MANIDNATNNLLYSINQRQIYTGKATNFNDRISELQAEIATLEGKTGKSTGNITTENQVVFSRIVTDMKMRLITIILIV